MDKDKDDAHEIVTEFSDSAKLKMEIIESLLEPCDRTTYGQRLREAALKLGKSVRTVQRLVKNWEQEGITKLTPTERASGNEASADSVVCGLLWESALSSARVAV